MTSFPGTEVVPMFSHIDLKGTVIRGSILASLVLGAGKLLSLVVYVLVARATDVRGFGLYSYALSWAEVLAVVSCIGMDSGVLRFIPTYIGNLQWRELRGLISWSITVVLAISLAFVGILEFVLLSLSLPTDKRIAVQVGLLLVPALSMQTLGQSILRGFKLVGQALLPGGVIQPLVMIAATLVCLLRWNTQGNAVRLLVVIAGAAYVATIWQYVKILMILRSVPRAGNQEFKPGPWLKVALPLGATIGFSALLAQLDILMLGTLGTGQETGLYSAAVRFARLASFGVMASTMIVAPVISELYYSDKYDELRRLFRFVRRMVTLFALMVFIVFLLFGGHILYIFGARYRLAYGSAIVLLVGQIINAASGPVGPLLAMTGQENLILLIYLTTCILNVCINVVLIPRYGIYGAAVATTLCIGFSRYLMHAAAKRHVLAEAAAPL